MTIEEWSQWIHDVRIISRYWSHVMKAEHWWWTGALIRSGHGRFWIGTYDGRNVVVAAHRFGYALAYGVQQLLLADLIMHTCDEPLCQNPDHLVAGTREQNQHEWQHHRHDIGSPFRDRRGRHGRAVAIRAAARTGTDIDTVIHAGLSDQDQNAPVLPGLESVSNLSGRPLTMNSIEKEAT